MKDLSRLIRRLSMLPDALNAAALAAAQDAAAEAVRTAKALVPVRTGALRASISATKTANGAMIRAARPYALYVELGTRRAAPHPYLLPAAREASFPDRAARAAKEVLP